MLFIVANQTERLGPATFEPPSIHTPAERLQPSTLYYHILGVSHKMIIRLKSLFSLKSKSV